MNIRVGLVTTSGVEERSAVRLQSLGVREPRDVASPEKKRARQGEDARPARRLILLVEDDRGVRNAIAGILEEEGHSVVLAENGRQALEKLDSAPSPDVIVLDLRMPVMDGWEFRAAQRRNPWFARIPVVAVSADRSPKAASIEVDAYLRKPLDRDVLLGVISWVTSEAARRSRDRQTFSLNSLVDAALAVSGDRGGRIRIRKLYGELHPVVAEVNDLRQALSRLIADVAEGLPAGDVRETPVTLRTYMKGPTAYLDIDGTVSSDPTQAFDLREGTDPGDAGTTATWDAARRIVENQGGRIEVRRGASENLIRVALPLAVPPVGQPGRGSVEMPVLQPVRAKILLIDDVAELGRAIARGLVEHDVTAVTSADAAFRLLASQSFDVIVCDVATPAIGGRGVLERLEKEWPHLVSRVLFMMGGAFAPDHRRLLQRTSDRVLAKPFGLGDLRAAIRKVQNDGGRE